MSDTNSHRIAKNTFFLYLRMLFLMVISLYTVRVVLGTLGAEDYGIYNLIGSVVILFSFINAASSGSTQRYLNFALGENDLKKAKNVFSSSVIIHVFVSFLILLLSESVGLYFINFYLEIPSSRISAANIAFQFSVLTTVVNVLRIPYNATIIAYEKMSFFAVLSALEGILKLAIVYVLVLFDLDKLVLYTILLLLVNLCITVCFCIYVTKNFKIAKVSLKNDKSAYKELLSFSAWNLISSIGDVFSTQGLTFILNKFCGVLANAAMGIANQVNNAVYSLISNFQVAFEPQIIKSYAAEEKEYLLKLIFKTSKFSFFLLYFFVLPLSLNSEFVLQLWLKEVPVYSVSFLNLILVFSLINALMGPLWMVAYAIGNIRNYQIVAFVNALLQLPIAYILLRTGCPPYTIIIVKIFSLLLFSVWRFVYLYKRMRFPVLKYILYVVVPVFFVVGISFIISRIAYLFFEGTLKFLFSCSVTVIVNIVAMYFIGCDRSERKYIITTLGKVLVKDKRNEL